MEIIEIQFKGQRKEFFENTKALNLRTGNYCVVQADRGEDMGLIISITRTDPAEAEADLKEIIRHATDQDVERLNEIRGKETEAPHEARRR
jgi:cell fate regulator YaaT (PSP1 superfamily)